jgi:hypothetical protein
MVALLTQIRLGMNQLHWHQKNPSFHLVLIDYAARGSVFASWHKSKGMVWNDSMIALQILDALAHGRYRGFSDFSAQIVSGDSS